MTKTTTKSTTEKSVAESKETKPVETTKPIKKTFKQDEGVLCRSITIGGLWLEGIKSKNIYRWSEYGDVTEIEYRDLISMVRSKSNYIFNPMFVIEDEDFIAEFPQLKKFYDEKYTIEDLEGVLALPIGSMVATIKTLPAGAITTLKSIASTQIANGQLDSVKKIKALDKIFGTELNLMSSLFQ